MGVTTTEQSERCFATGRAAARAHAELLGLDPRRVPPVRAPGLDIPHHPWIGFESKAWDPDGKWGLPVRVREAMEQAERHVRDLELRRGVVKMPAALIHSLGEAMEVSLFVVRAQVAIDWLGIADPAPPRGHPVFRR